MAFSTTHKSIALSHFTIKVLPNDGARPRELSANMKSHPLSYMELSFDPEPQGISPHANRHGFG